MSRSDLPRPFAEPDTAPPGVERRTAHVSPGTGAGEYEQRRLQALRAYGVLDTPPEEAFDRLTRLAARLFGMPVVLVSFVDDTRQWFKSCHGLTDREHHRDVSFCSHAVAEDFHEELLEVPDATLDPRFRDNPLVLGTSHLRYYVGAPLVTAAGDKLGTLCLIDTAPRAPLSGEDRRTLTDLARVVVNELELRRRNVELQRSVLDRMDELERLAYTDALTGLGNRRALDAALDAHPGAAVRDLHIVMLDIDELKIVNDRDGHARGDTLIRAVAHALKHTFDGHGHAYRLGGDEFVVLIPGDRHDEQTVRDLTLEALLRARGTEFPRLDASIGVAHLPSEAEVPGELLRRAGERMLRQKARRRAARRLGNLAEGREVSAGTASEVVRRAVYSTLALLASDRDLDDAGWGALLEAAVAAVLGAETGSLYVRDGGDFVIRAQVGFSDRLVGLRQPERASRAWYGEPEGWTQGRARVISGVEVVMRSEDVDVSSGLHENSEVYAAHGDLDQIRANLCVPVVVHGEVVAKLNLDNVRHEDAFTPGSLLVAEEFAVQVAALLGAHARRTREAARQRELEGLAAVSAALHEVATPEEAEAVLVDKARELLGARRVVLARFRPDDAARPFGERLNGWPRGEDAARSALDRREVVECPALPGDVVAGEAVRGDDGGALLAAPLYVADGTAMGVLVAARHGQGSPLDTRLMAGIAAAGATAIERARGTVAIRARAEEFRMLAELSMLTVTLTDPHDIARCSLRACREFLGAHHASFEPITRTGVVRDGHVPRIYRSAIARARTRELRRVTRASRSGPPLATHDYPSEPYAVTDLVRAGVRAQVTVPVFQNRTPCGLLRFVWFSPLTALPPAASALAVRAAELIGQALEREAHVRQVEATREGALLALGLALERRDFETSGHTERVVELCTALGRELGLSAAEMEGLRQGAYLHDLGKLAVPDAVLLKPGKLTPNEFDVMRRHAEIGFDVTAHIPALHPLARQVIRHHHERYDGGGYPSGRSGEDIPLVARVFSVVDVFDALVNTRPYKRAWTREEALSEIRREVGRQFDPGVVAAFERLVRRQAGEDAASGANS